MTLLEQILQASKNPENSISTEPLKYPITFNADPIIQTLKPISENPNPLALIQPLDGFRISQPDSDLIDSGSALFIQLKGMLENPTSLSSDKFIDVLNSFLGKIAAQKSGKVGRVKDTGVLLEKYGSFVGKDVMGLLIEGFVLMEKWGLLETLIVNKLVDHGFCSDLIYKLVSKKQSNLICLCLMHFSDIKVADLSRALKYILSPSEEGLINMRVVREEWEKEALLAIEKAANGKLSKDASILLMIAYDGFTSPELCLHFVVSSNVVDDVIFSSAISKLNAEEMLGLIRYLGKFLRKYESFPRAVPCPKAESVLGLKMCRWIPKLEDVVKCLGLVIDEHFSSLALHSGFHGELKDIEGIVSSLVSEGRLCCSVTNVIEVLKPKVGGA